MPSQPNIVFIHAESMDERKRGKKQKFYKSLKLLLKKMEMLGIFDLYLFLRITTTTQGMGRKWG